VAEDPNPSRLIGGVAEKMVADADYRAAAGRLRHEMAGQPTPAAVVPALCRLLERS